MSNTQTLSIALHGLSFAAGNASANGFFLESEKAELAAAQQTITNQLIAIEKDSAAIDAKPDLPAAEHAVNGAAAALSAVASSAAAAAAIVRLLDALAAVEHLLR